MTRSPHFESSVILQSVAADNKRLEIRVKSRETFFFFFFLNVYEDKFKRAVVTIQSPTFSSRGGKGFETGDFGQCQTLKDTKENSRVRPMFSIKAEGRKKKRKLVHVPFCRRNK